MKPGFVENMKIVHNQLCAWYTNTRKYVAPLRQHSWGQVIDTSNHKT